MDLVAKTMGVSWDVVFGKPATEFLNVICYAKDKADYEKEQLEQWRKTH